MRRDVADTVVGVLHDDLGACMEHLDAVRRLSSLQAGWEREMPVFGARWFVETFVDDPSHRARLFRMVDEARRFFLDLARLSPEPVALDENLIAQLQRRLLLAAYPTSYELAVGARGHPAAKASANLKRRVTEAQWRGE